MIITSGLRASILLKIGVKSVVSGEKRMWVEHLQPDLTEAGLVAGVERRRQAASSLTMTAVFILSGVTKRSFAASQTSPASAVDVR